MLSVIINNVQRYIVHLESNNYYVDFQGAFYFIPFSYEPIYTPVLLQWIEEFLMDCAFSWEYRKQLARFILQEMSTKTLTFEEAEMILLHRRPVYEED